MYYGVIKNTTKVIHNSASVEEIQRNIMLLNSNEETEIISFEEFQQRITEENKNKIIENTTQDKINAQLLKDNAEQQLLNAQLLKEIANLKGGNV